MLTKADMHNYQAHCVEHIIDNPFGSLFLGLGLGKTISTLTAINQLMFEDFEVSKVLVIAPKRVSISVWPKEAQKWAHLTHIRVSVITGDEKARKAAIRANADVFTINRENVPWLVANYGAAWPWDMVVLDESSSFKSAKSARFKALRSVRPKISRIVALTGTPASNSLLDLWAQIYLLDQGQRLGKTLQTFKDRYFECNPHEGGPSGTYSIRRPEYLKIEKTDKKDVREAKKRAVNPFESEIYGKIQDICISMKAEDYLELPKRIDVVQKVELSASMMQKYQEFEKSLVLGLPNGEEISPFNAAGLSNKLMQFASGAVYDADKKSHRMHDEKLEALSELVEAANGSPLLVFYWYQHELERLMAYFKSYKPKTLEDQKMEDRWNRGEVPLMFVHPQSAGHGLNLQYGSHLTAWYTTPWSLELYDQGVGRVDRQGQRFPVTNTKIVCAGTIDEEVIKSHVQKTNVQDALMAAVKAIVKKYT